MSNIFEKSQLDLRSNPNLFINGDMGVNQRGFNAISYSNYTLDRWQVFSFGGLTSTTVNQAQDTMPGLGINLAYGMRCRSLGTGSYGIFQKIEGGDFFSQTFTVSGKSRAETGSVKFTGGEVYLYDGSTFHNIASLSANVDITFNGNEYSVSFDTPEPDYSTYGEIQYMQIEFHFEDLNTSADVYHTHFKCERGSVATPFIPDDPATNLAKCQRYYESSYRWQEGESEGHNFGSNATSALTNGAFIWHTQSAGWVGAIGTAAYKVPKMRAPAFRVYDTAGNADRATRVGSSSNVAPTAGNLFGSPRENGWVVDVRMPEGDAAYGYHWAADAEL